VTRDVVIMVAPNGARKTKTDHPALPVSIADTVSEAEQCFAAGASALHGHVRGAEDEHVLDAGLYRELIGEMSRRVPGMLMQITTEAVGRYTPQQQVDCIQAVRPVMASVILREVSSNFDNPEFAREFFAWSDDNQVHIQHILFSAEEFDRFHEFRQRGVIPPSHRCVLFVLGRYNVNFQSDPADLEPFLQRDLDGLDWFTCAFGQREQECVLKAVEAGGHARIGFENNLYLPDGSVADNTAQLVESLAAALGERNLRPASGAKAAQLLGVRSA
jgi:3-keto-5-aminohexanoate cleavage enzyme